jgi:hypothetical protein
VTRHDRTGQDKARREHPFDMKYEIVNPRLYSCESRQCKYSSPEKEQCLHLLGGLYFGFLIVLTDRIMFFYFNTEY